ncbi:MAG: GlyGly-CTERM sorting domain-containing protein, partial [Myxococcales bacterium]
AGGTSGAGGAAGTSAGGTSAGGTSAGGTNAGGASAGSNGADPNGGLELEGGFCSTTAGPVSTSGGWWLGLLGLLGLRRRKSNG